MNDVLRQSQAESIILSYKLDKIRKHTNQRLSIVEPVTANELKTILNLISTFENVPANWSLEEPFVNIPAEEEK